MSEETPAAGRETEGRTTLQPLPLPPPPIPAPAPPPAEVHMPEDTPFRRWRRRALWWRQQRGRRRGWCVVHVLSSCVQLRASRISSPIRSINQAASNTVSKLVQELQELLVYESKLCNLRGHICQRNFRKHKTSVNLTSLRQCLVCGLAEEDGMLQDLP